MTHLDLHSAKISRGRVIVPLDDGSTVSMSGNEAWIHAEGQTQSIPIESLGFEEVKFSLVNGQVRATLRHTDGWVTDITLRKQGPPTVRTH